MLLVGGPQGSGKSTFFPVSDTGHDSFNVDDERKRLNRGSSQNIPQVVQRAATRAYEGFIESHIESARSFAVEVTLGRDVTFDQAKRARAAGFSVRLVYIAAELGQCIERMAGRVEAGGHGVPVAVLRRTHAASMRNLSRAIREFDVVEVFDNSRHAAPGEPTEAWEPKRALMSQGGTITYKVRKPPLWLRRAIKRRG